jgi:trimeric autotransporter adhesin
MQRLSYSLALLSILALVGCGGGNSGSSTTPVLQAITVTATKLSAVPGHVQQFTATGTYSSGPSKDLTSSVMWSSSDTSVASIGSTGGLVTASATGTTTIKATSGAISGSAIFTVEGPVSIAVAPPTKSIAKMTFTAFAATGTYSDGSVSSITSTATWSSSDTNVATVSDVVPTKGTAMALTAGPTTISATVGSVSGTASLTVTNATLVSIAVTPAGMSIPLGVQQQFTATGTFNDATTQDITGTVTWASTGNSIASITVSGLATGLKLGTVTISATSGAISGSTSLTVNAANLASLVVNPADPSIALNTTQQFAAVGTFNDGSTKNLTGQATWTSSDTTVATIGVGNGLAKGIKVGTTTITATIGTFTPSVTLTVTNATASTITVTPSAHSIAPGSKLGFTATAQFNDGSTQVITSSATWVSDNTAAATVNAAGIALGVAAGTANISATFGGVTGSAPLTVTGATLSSITVTPTSTVLAPSSSLIYQAVGTYSDNSMQNISNVVTWSSSAAGTVSITATGQATGQSAGTATITATLGSVSNTANVVVESTALQSIVVTPTTMSIPVLVGLQYKAVGTFGDGSTQDLTNSVTWTSSKPAFATISNSAGNSGLAVGVSPGGTNITGAFAGIVGTATLTVNNAALQSVTVSPSSATITLGSSQQFTANGNFSDGSTFNVTNQVAWTSTNINVAIVTGGGLANSAAAGTTTIKAVLGSAPAGTATLTVN